MCYFIPLFQHATETSSSQSPPGPHQTTTVDEAKQASKDSHKKPPAGLLRICDLYQTGSIKDLISKFSGSGPVLSYGSARSRFSEGRLSKAYSVEVLSSTGPISSSSTNSFEEVGSPVPSIIATPTFSSRSIPEAAQNDTKTSQIAAKVDCPVEGSTEKTEPKPRNKSQKADYGSDSVADSGMGSVSAEKKLLIDLFDVLA